jgi:hypothetical protein
MNLSDLKNIFSPEAFVKGEDGLSRIKSVSLFYDMLSLLWETRGIAHHWEYKASGVHPVTGLAYYVGHLTLSAGESSCTMVGIADGDKNAPEIGIAGLASLALGNAMMRGFGMAAFLYENEQSAPQHYENHPPQQQYQPTQPTHQPQQTQQYQPPPQQYQQPQAPQPRGYRQQPQLNSGGGKPFPPWDGSLKVKSGDWGGTAYRDIPINILQGWANQSQPNQLAVKELQRRAGAPDTSSAFSR